jgi:hypothetical protein
VKNVRNEIELLISEVLKCKGEDSTFGISGSLATSELNGYLNSAVDLGAISEVERTAYLNRVK